jgi:hypothetical protein
MNPHELEVPLTVLFDDPLSIPHGLKSFVVWQQE